MNKKGHGDFSGLVYLMLFLSLIPMFLIISACQGISYLLRNQIKNEYNRNILIQCAIVTALVFAAYITSGVKIF